MAARIGFRSTMAILSEVSKGLDPAADDCSVDQFASSVPTAGNLFCSGFSMGWMVIYSPPLFAPKLISACFGGGAHAICALRAPGGRAPVTLSSARICKEEPGDSGA